MKYFTVRKVSVYSQGSLSKGLITKPLILDCLVETGSEQS